MAAWKKSAAFMARRAPGATGIAKVHAWWMIWSSRMECVAEPVCVREARPAHSPAGGLALSRGDAWPLLLLPARGFVFEHSTCQRTFYHAPVSRMAAHFRLAILSLSGSSDKAGSRFSDGSVSGKWEDNAERPGELCIKQSYPGLSMCVRALPFTRSGALRGS